MGNKPVNAIPGKQGFQRTGRKDPAKVYRASDLSRDPSSTAEDSGTSAPSYDSMLARMRAAVTTRYERVKKWVNAEGLHPVAAEIVSKERRSALRTALTSGLLAAGSATMVSRALDNPGSAASLSAALLATAAAGYGYQAYRKAKDAKPRAAWAQKYMADASILDNAEAVFGDPAHTLKA